MSGCCTRTASPQHERPLPAGELNVARYVGGYVARSVLRRYEKSKSEVASQFVVYLGNMAVEGEGGDVLTYTRKWIQKVNRDGFYPLSDESFTLFAYKENCVRELLPKHVLKTERFISPEYTSKSTRG